MSLSKVFAMLVIAALLSACTTASAQTARSYPDVTYAGKFGYSSERVAIAGSSSGAHLAVSKGSTPLRSGKSVAIRRGATRHM